MKCGIREYKIGQVDMKNGNLLVIEVGMWYLASFMLVVTDWLDINGKLLCYSLNSTHKLFFFFILLPELFYFLLKSV